MKKLFLVQFPRFDRGYTGHEIMAGFGLINMNGRLYDPYLQRFLSPDIIVQDPSNGQNYNRYSYCLNNPLRYTDPSGWYEVGEDIPNYILNPYGSDGGTGDAFSDVTPVGTPIPEVVCTATRTPQLYNISGSLMQILGDFANNNVPSYTPSSNTTVPNKLGTLGTSNNQENQNIVGKTGINQNNVDFATAVINGTLTVLAGAAEETAIVSNTVLKTYVPFGGAAVTGIDVGIAIATNQAKPSHVVDGGITAALVTFAIIAPEVGLPVLAGYGVYRLVLGSVTDNMINENLPLKH